MKVVRRGAEGTVKALCSPAHIKNCTEPYGKRLEKLSIPFDPQQSADRTSAEGVI